MIPKTTEREESNSLEALFQHTERSLKPFKLSYEEIPLPTLQSVCFDQLVLSEQLSNELESLREDLTNRKGLAMDSCQMPVYQMSLPLEKPSGHQNITVLQLLKPYMMPSIATAGQV